MMVTLPALMAVAEPVALLMLLTVGLLLLHTPPVTVEEKVAPVPAHKVAGPVMVPTEGAGLTVILVVAVAVPQVVVTV